MLLKVRKQISDNFISSMEGKQSTHVEVLLLLFVKYAYLAAYALIFLMCKGNCHEV